MVSRSIATVLWLLCILGAFTGCADSQQSGERPGSVVLSSTMKPFPWTIDLTNVEPGLNLNPGDEWSLDFDANVDLRRFEKKYGEFLEIIVALQCQLRHDEDGFYRQGDHSLVVSSNFTTTGVPVERFDGWPSLRLLRGKDGSPIEAIRSFAIPNGRIARRHKFSGKLVAKLPADAPVGWYEPRIMAWVRVAGVEDPVMLENYGDNSNTQDEQLLPLIRVGQPATPRLPWTIFSDEHYRGQSGALPKESKGRIGLCGRSGFPATLILEPRHYTARPAFPTIFPFATTTPVDGGTEVFSMRINNDLDFKSGSVSCSASGPSGHFDFGTMPMNGEDFMGPALDRGGFMIDMSKTGRYEIEMTGFINDKAGRRFEGGGVYEVYSAHPLSFSTSCKPGSGFLVGDAYPGKVNVNPPFPAQVEVKVEYYPNSDASRRIVWIGKGVANRFGHFIPYDAAPMTFDEPGEYLSTVTASYTDNRGGLWMGQQTSAGVVAPVEPVLHLHGTRTFPYDIKDDQDYLGGVKRFENRLDVTTTFLPFMPAPMPDPFAPYDPRDTLFIPSNGYNESIVEPHLSMQLDDPKLAKKLREAYRIGSELPPPLLQSRPDPWDYLHDVVRISADSAAWFPADEAHGDELPIQSVGNGRWHSFAHPEARRVEAYIYLGVVRPGFPVMTSVMESEALGLYWLASPNQYGFHFNTGYNGDLPGDVYRIQAGAVLKDFETGRNYYDVYGASIAVAPSEGAVTSILPPGEKPLVVTKDREHYIFLATDPNDVLEVGEIMGLGGMIFPSVEADVTWNVTKPSGEVVMVEAIANRLGIARGKPALLVDEPGAYAIDVDVRYENLRGDVVGTPDGRFYHFVVPKDGPELFQSSLAPITRVNPLQGLRIPLRWSDKLRNVKITYGVMMPGRMLDQDVVEVSNDFWEYGFNPHQMSAQFPNLDSRNFATGDWELADTIVFQFLLEAEDENAKVFDSLRLVMRDDVLYNYRLLCAGHGG
jgi:hypothetical protein